MMYQDLLDAAALEQYAAALNARAKAARAVGRLAAAVLRDRILASGGRCEWCGANLVGAEFELDHVVSLKQRGRNQAGNLVVACPECNRRKGQKHPARFAAEIYTETGYKTALIDRVFQHYALEAKQQRELFAAESESAAHHLDLDRTASDAAPPYRW